MEHHLQVIVFAEDALVPLYRVFGGLDVAGDNILGDFPRQACAGADETLVVLFQELVVDAGAVVEALDVPERDQFHEVVVACLVLGQENEVVVPLVLRVFELVVVMSGYVHFAAENGLYPRMLLGHVVELLHAVHVAVVGDGETRHAQLLGPLEKLFDVGKPVEHGILRMDVKVYE